MNTRTLHTPAPHTHTHTQSHLTHNTLTPTPHTPLREIALRLRVLTISTLGQEHFLVLNPPLIEVAVYNTVRCRPRWLLLGGLRVIRLRTAVMVTLDGSHHRDQLCGLVATAILRLRVTKDKINTPNMHSRLLKHNIMWTLRGLINNIRNLQNLVYYDPCQNADCKWSNFADLADSMHKIF